MEINLKLPVAYKKNVVYSTEEMAKRGEPIMGDWTADAFIYMFFFLYLVEKYKSKCFYHSIHIDFVEIQKSIKNGTYNKLEKINAEEYKLVVGDIAKCLYYNPDTEIVLIPLIVNLQCQPYIAGWHMNLLVYRVQENKIEHFEPNGSFFSPSDIIAVECYKNLTNIIKQIVLDLEESRFQMTHFGNILTEKAYSKFTPKQVDNLTQTYTDHKVLRIRLIHLHEITPGLGLQVIESMSNIHDLTRGYCAAWCMFYAELVLKNPELDGNSLIKLLLEDVPLGQSNEKNWNDYFRNVIKGYVLVIQDKVQALFKKVYGINVTLKQIVNVRKNIRGPDEAHLPSSDEMLGIMDQYIRYKQLLESVPINKKVVEYFQNITPVSTRIHDFSVKQKSYRSLKEKREVGELEDSKHLEDLRQLDKYYNLISKNSQPNRRNSFKSRGQKSIRTTARRSNSSIENAENNEAIQLPIQYTKRQNVEKNPANNIGRQSIKKILPGKTRKKSGIRKFFGW